MWTSRCWMFARLRRGGPDLRVLRWFGLREPELPATPAHVVTAVPDLRILAGSELKELEPDILSAAHSAGVTVALSYAGTLEIVDRVNAGRAHRCDSSA